MHVKNLAWESHYQTVLTKIASQHFDLWEDIIMRARISEFRKKSLLQKKNFRSCRQLNWLVRPKFQIRLICEPVMEQILLVSNCIFSLFYSSKFTPYFVLHFNFHNKTCFHLCLTLLSIPGTCQKYLLRHLSTHWKTDTTIQQYQSIPSIQQTNVTWKIIAIGNRAIIIAGTNECMNTFKV